MDVSIWLRDLGLENYAEAFRANHIDAEVLPRLTADDFIALGITSIGHRRKLLHAIAALDQETPSTTEPIATAMRPLEAERRQLTVLFCDLVGSTELAARLDPEDLRDVMRAYQAACAEVVGRFEGHVARFLGDGVLAYFGWPQAHEDDAERAARSGLQLVQDVARLAPRAEVRLQARVGIATGHVVVGDLISESMWDKDAVSGDTPNLAARLQALAAPGSVVISQATRRLVGGLFELVDLGPQRIKGFAEPLSAWQVEGEGRAEGRFEALHGERLTPLVGREHELGILLGRWALAKDGDGQVVLLSGEPGIGKSRVIRALRERLGDEPYKPRRQQRGRRQRRACPQRSQHQSAAGSDGGTDLPRLRQRAVAARDRQAAQQGRHPWPLRQGLGPEHRRRQLRARHGDRQQRAVHRQMGLEPAALHQGPADRQASVQAESPLGVGHQGGAGAAHRRRRAVGRGQGPSGGGPARS